MNLTDCSGVFALNNVLPRTQQPGCLEMSARKELLALPLTYTLPVFYLLYIPLSTVRKSP